MHEHLFDNKGKETIFPIENRKNEAVRTLSMRDSNIYRMIKAHPGLRYPQLQDYLKVIDPTLGRGAFGRRIASMTDLIEFRGAPKTGGYFVKNNFRIEYVY